MSQSPSVVRPSSVAALVARFMATLSAIIALVASTLVASTLVASTLVASTAAAQLLVIKDCNGFTRAAEQVGDNPQRVQLQTRNAIDGARITLTSDATGEVSTAEVLGGTAVFFSVLPGIYTIGTEESGVLIETIGLSAMPLVGGVASTIVGGIVVGGGLTGGIIGVHELTDGNPGSSPPPQPTPPSPVPTPLPDCPACDPDNAPPSLDGPDDFFDGDLPNDTNEPLSPTT